MGLITKEVEVKLDSASIKYYESLGYEIPRKANKHGRIGVSQGTTIIIKVEDLKINSKVEVKTNCDCCGRLKNMSYAEYNKHSHNGLTYCYNCAIKILRAGENHPRWKFDLTQEERENGRNYFEYTEFIKRVLARDNYTCQCCDQEHGDLEVHHLDGYDWCIEKRTDDTNGITLCNTCHKSFHMTYGYGKNTKAQFEKWIGKAIEFLKYDGILPTARKIYDYEDKVIYDCVDECALKFNSPRNTIYKCCNQSIYTKIHKNKDGTEILISAMVNSVKGHHLFWLDEYENMTEKEIKSIVEYKNKSYTMVICITTGVIFEKISDAAKKYNINEGGISNVCREKAKTSGKLPDGTPLQWMYYKDFLKLPIEEQNEILARNKDSSNDGSFIN